MNWDAWIIFALFWAVFVVTPGPNAVNCITNGMTIGFRSGLWAVVAILTQASLFLTLSALGVTALIVASPVTFQVVQMIGAAFLIYLGGRGWIMARRPVRTDERPGGSVYWRAFAIATINPKSVAGYLAAFSQFVQPDVPIGQQMWVIFPTALTLTCLSYVTYTALGAGIGRAALGAVFNVWLRRGLALCFIIYGILLGTAASPGRN
ncbi:Leucine efflux protein [Roseovarius litorisediminis]|uniref:Leucine efflux protein n=1 Tax=Roseovarius litorisediminis TaxID=1312363 RepID=A0A1Y5RZM7_9RHOB|nr:LysE family translocator [Roseovarius litorisediminis]SLN29379.1 Leucine efflux protein [Roseovarius litorisediminis]